MKELLAPNGKPSNLTPDQYKLVREPAFISWFGNWEKLALTKLNDSGIDEVSLKRLEDGVSKFVDSNGEPLVFYRGNKVNQEDLGYIFDLGHNFLNKPHDNNFGFFFTDSIDVAKRYMENDIWGTLKGGSISSVFLNSKKILDLTDFGTRISQGNFLNGLITKGISFNNDYSFLEDKIVNYFEENTYYGWGAYVFDYFDILPELRNLFLENGYTSVVFYEDSRYNFPYKVFVTFESNQIKLADGTNTTFDGNNPDIRFKDGGRTISQTPAPKKDQIKGSDKNKEGSAKDISSAKKIKFSDDVLEKIQNSVDKHNEKHPNKKINLDSAKAVVRRGMGAYSSTHRPTISGGNENSRVAWGLARLNAFTYKIVNGKSKSGKYSQDNDLIEELGYKVQKYSDGGDIQAYEEALGISEFAEGGEAKPKKVYVSIRLPYELEKIENTFNEYFNNYSEKPFEELKNQKLEGLVGVSSSPNNIAEWFIHRDCLIVMNYDEFIALNETETINYYDPYQLMKNNLFMFKRLYANVGARSGNDENPYVFIQTLKKILEKIIPEINLEMNVAEGQKYKELYRISQFLSPYITRDFPDWIEKNEIKINSPVDLTEAILQFNKLNDGASYLGYGFENPVLTFDELLPFVEKGIVRAGSIYDSEQEIVLTNRELNIPKNSQLFFIGKDNLGRTRESNKLELIEKYKLKDLYKIHFVDLKDVEKYRSIWLKKEEEKFNKNLEIGKAGLELKKEQVVNEILNIFLEKSINSFKEQFEKDYISEYSELKEYYDNESDDYEEIFWYDIPLVQFILNKYIEIVKANWERFITSKSVKDLSLYSFSNFCSEVEYQLKDFFENNKEQLEKINDYRESKGNGYLDLYGFQQLLKKSVNHYESLPEWFDYKKLSKMYLEKMGGEIYRYYDKKDLPLISQYKDGGETDEPTQFWGTEAGGVLVYCSTTERYLILLRSQWVLEPNTWGIISGKLDDGENVQQAVFREAEEETGHKLGKLIPSFIFEKSNFKFHNFVSIVHEEFTPKLDWENSDYKWVKLNEMPKNLHFGLKILIEKEDLPNLIKKHKMENEILIVDMNMYRYNTTVTFKNKEIPLKLNPPKNEVQFIEWAEENNIEFEQWGDVDMIDTSWGYDFEVPLFKYIEYMKTEKFYTGGELKKGIKTEMEHKNTLSKIKTGKFSVEEGATMIAKDHLEENDKYYTHLEKMESEFEEGGKVQSIHSEKGDIKVSLDENWYADDSSVELVPVSELIKFREFDRKVNPKYNKENSLENINHLKYMFQKDGVKSPIIIEYSADDNAVLIIEGNHRLNSAIDLGMEYLPARVVLKKYGNYSPLKLKNTMKVGGIKANSHNYIPSDLKPSQIGIAGAKPIVYAEGGIIEGRLHSECGEDGCGRKFQVGENGHIIEAERDEAVIVADAFDNNNQMTVKGTPSEIASALNVIGGGKNFDKGAKIIEGGAEKELPQMKQEATNTDVDDVIDSGSIIINRRSMADKKEYTVTGTPKQIASAINSIDGNGVVIEKGAKIE
jgi:8-oxo-dGTP pyrophosphatase MutT (NUDIX family)